MSGDLSVLETAYIEVSDDRNMTPHSITTATTKSMLSVLSKSRTQSLSNSKTIKVQFNPNTLTFSYGKRGTDNTVKTSIVHNEEGQAPQSQPNNDNATSISISFGLVFDRSVNIDSSVQPEVEQFISLLRNPYVRQITFYWGTMCYKGSLNSITAEYVLFNRFGIPMRANVSVSMQLK